MTTSPSSFPGETTQGKGWRGESSSAAAAGNEGGGGRSVVAKIFVAGIVLLLPQAYSLRKFQGMTQHQSTNSLQMTATAVNKGCTTTMSTIISNGIIEQEYQWIGDHWIPLNGVPTYTLNETLSTFGNYNVLWMGDSTSRQSYATLLAMMETPVDGSNSISVSDLERGKNTNKGGKIQDKCILRDFTNTNNVLGAYFTEGTLRCKQQPNPYGNKKFDGAYYLICAKNYVGFVETEQNKTLTPMLPGEYDLVIVQFGAWEVERPWDCRHGGNDTALTRIQDSLSSLQQIASPNLIVIWKTHGISERANGNVKYKIETEEINRVTKEWFEAHQPKHMYMVDWGTQQSPRSLGEDRITGDLAAHWGLEARLLGIQMVTHALRAIAASSREGQ